jgi:hypothetical protein
MAHRRAPRPAPHQRPRKRTRAVPSTRRRKSVTIVSALEERLRYSSTFETARAARFDQSESDDPVKCTVPVASTLVACRRRRASQIASLVR